MAEITEFNIGQGETFRILLTVSDNSTGLPLDVADYTFAGQVRENYNTNVVAAALSFENATPTTSGSMYIGMTDEVTLTLNQRKYVYDVNMTSIATGRTRRLLEGYLVVRRTATR